MKFYDPNRAHCIVPIRTHDVKRVFQVATKLPSKTRMTGLVSHPTNKQTINYRNIILRSPITLTLSIRYNLMRVEENAFKTTYIYNTKYTFRMKTIYFL